jgi:hypothetical protein
MTCVHFTKLVVRHIRASPKDDIFYITSFCTFSVFTSFVHFGLKYRGKPSINKG